MNVTLADGQLAAAAADLFVGVEADPARVNVVCQNTSAVNTETVLLTFKRGTGATARRIVRAVLAPNEQLVVTGLALEIGDTILGAATDATTVDYLVTAAGDVPFSITVLDANGSLKQVATIAGGNQTVTGILTVGGMTRSPIAALTVNGAIDPHTSAVYAITKAGILADTLAAPTVTVDDGVEIEIFSDTANAHTLTATALLDTGSANAAIATFAAFKGAGLKLRAYNGRWKVISQIGITFT